MPLLTREDHVKMEEEWMKHRKKMKGGRRLPHTLRAAPKRRVVQMEPEELASFVRQAEAYACPRIRELHIPPSVAVFVLAQYTHVLATGSERVTIESATSITASVLELWQRGTYTPGPDYPYTLEETLRDEGVQQADDYADSFQAYLAAGTTRPRGRTSIEGGLVKHPETGYWQLWLMLEGTCEQIAAYHDSEKGQGELEALIALLRTGGTLQNMEGYYDQLCARSDGEPRQIPFQMVVYLLENLDRYRIPL